jgi:hypothetical protein
MQWTFTARPAAAVDALGGLELDLPPSQIGDLERLVVEAAAGLPDVEHEWTLAHTRYGLTLKVEPSDKLSEGSRSADSLDRSKESPPSAFADTRHRAGRS